MNISTSTLSFYLSLQYRRVQRAFNDNGIYPWIAVPLLFGVFVFITFKLLGGFAFGEFIYGGLALSISSSIADNRRFDFVKSISTIRDYRLIRLAEQLVISIPFTIGYIFFGWWLFGLLLLLAAGVLSISTFNFNLPYTLPTPFWRRPFEFARGVRGALFPIIGCYLLVPIGMSVDNFNLSLASIAGIGLIAGNFFIQPEPRFYIWIHAMDPQKFLLEKSKSILAYTLLTLLPIVTALIIYNPTRIGSIALMILAAVAFVEMCMLAKYVAYPSDINIVAGFAMGGSILFPPLMLAIIPIFYFKAIRRLEPNLR